MAEKTRHTVSGELDPVHILRNNPTDTSRQTLWKLGLVVFGLALIIRTIGLDSWPYIHDEAIHANYAYQNANWLLGREQADGTRVAATPREYDPVYHGPLQYYLVATSFLINGTVNTAGLALTGRYWDDFDEFTSPLHQLPARKGENGYIVLRSPYTLDLYWNYFLRQVAVHGANDRTGRMASVFFGCVLCAIPLAFTRQLGLGVTTISSLMLLFFVPTVAYFSRIVLYDIMCLAMEFCVVACYLQWLRKRQMSMLLWAFFFLSCDLCLKPTAMIWLAFLAMAAVGDIIISRGGILRGDGSTLRNIIQEFRVEYVPPYLVGIVMIAVMWLMLYTDFGTFPKHYFALSEIVTHWGQMHEIERLPGTNWYHQVLTAVYSPLLGAATLWGLALLFISERPVVRFFVWWTWGACGAYFMAGEKGPWLANHTLAPAAILASMLVFRSLQGAFLLRPGALRIVARVGLTVCLLLMAYSLYAHVRLVYYQPAFDYANAVMSSDQQRQEAFEKSRKAGGPISYIALTPDRFEISTYVATSMDFKRVMDLMVARSVRRYERDLDDELKSQPWRGRFSASDEAAWPTSWYGRDGALPAGSIGWFFPQDWQNYEIVIFKEGLQAQRLDENGRPVMVDGKPEMMEVAKQAEPLFRVYRIPLRSFYVPPELKGWGEALDEWDKEWVNGSKRRQWQLQLRRQMQESGNSILPGKDHPPGVEIGIVRAFNYFFGRIAVSDELPRLYAELHRQIGAVSTVNRRLTLDARTRETIIKGQDRLIKLARDVAAAANKGDLGLVLQLEQERGRLLDELKKSASAERDQLDGQVAALRKQLEDLAPRRGDPAVEVTARGLEDQIRALEPRLRRIAGLTDRVHFLLWRIMDVAEYEARVGPAPAVGSAWMTMLVRRELADSPEFPKELRALEIKNRFNPRPPTRP